MNSSRHFVTGFKIPLSGSRNHIIMLNLAYSRVVMHKFVMNSSRLFVTGFKIQLSGSRNHNYVKFGIQ